MANGSDTLVAPLHPDSGAFDTSVTPHAIPFAPLTIPCVCIRAPLDLAYIHTPGQKYLGFE